MWDFVFFLNSILLGVGLAMDAFSVSLVSGLNEPDMPKTKRLAIAGTFGGFQAIMPLIGWVCVHYLAQVFELVNRAVPYVALILLAFIGTKMIITGIGQKDDEKPVIGLASLITQGIATSIDALSVGFTIAEYDVFHALVSALIIAAVTFGICLVGVFVGRKASAALSDKASIVGGVILIAIGIEIFVAGVFF
jgi:putative Mn2+ efflux pump MntP